MYPKVVVIERRLSERGVRATRLRRYRPRMLLLGRVLASAGAAGILVGFICQTILVTSYRAAKSKDGYFAYVHHTFQDPFGFFRYVFRELEHPDWRRGLAAPWLLGFGGGLALVIAGASLLA